MTDAADRGAKAAPEPVDLQGRLALRPKEAAQALGIGERTLRQMLPELPHIHLGQAVLLPIEPLREWLRERVEVEKSAVDEAVDDVLRAVVGGD